MLPSNWPYAAGESTSFTGRLKKWAGFREFVGLCMPMGQIRRHLPKDRTRQTRPAPVMGSGVYYADRDDRGYLKRGFGAGWKDGNGA